MTASRLLTVGVFAALLGLVSAAGQPPPDPQITRTFGDWKARLERFQSVRYTISGVTERVNKDEVPPEMKDRVVPEPPGPKEKPLKAKILIDIANKRFRLEETEQVPSKQRDRWVSRLKVTAFNGKTYQRALPREHNDLGPQDTDISVSKGNLAAQRAAAPYLWPVFMAHGIVPTVDTPLRPDRFPTEHEPEDFAPGGPVTHAGRQCVVLKTNPTGTKPNISDEYWVDPGRQSAILRHTYWQVQLKNPWFRLDIEYTQSPNGWLPAKWTQTHSIGGKLMISNRLTVDSVEVNPALREEDFTIPIEPGMIVNTYEYPERGKGLDPQPARGKYRAGPGGDLEPIEPPTGFTTTEGVQLPPESGRRWLWWTVGAVGLIVVLLVVFQLWRRRRVNQ